MSSLREPFGSLFNWLSGTAHHAGIHLTEFGHLGHMVLIEPFGVLRLDFDYLLKRLDANELSQVRIVSSKVFLEYSVISAARA